MQVQGVVEVVKVVEYVISDASARNQNECEERTVERKRLESVVRLPRHSPRQ